MKRIINRTNSLVVLVIMLLACLIGATTLTVTTRTANAQEQEEQTSTVELTSYTSVMNVDEEFEFAALVTNEDGTTSTDVEWTSSDEGVIFFEDAGLAYASSEGTATLTATAEDGSYASIDVLVSDEAILVEGVTVDPSELSLYVGDTAQLSALVLPEDATDKTVTWKSSDESVATVDADGLVTAVGAGQATITVTTNDHMFTAECAVAVTAYGEATLSADSLNLKIDEIGTLTVTLPDGVTADTYEWTSSVTDVATPGVNAQDTAEIYTWNFGTTIITVTVTDTDGAKYRASATVLVSADFFYLVGLEDDWTLYETAEEAEAAGVLLIPVEGQPNVYALTRSVKAYQGFQIVHSGMDKDWTTKITPYWYSPEGSSDDFVDNTLDNFQVTAYGSYTITLNLNDGMAKVYINMQDVFVTEINLSLSDGATVFNSLDDYAVIDLELRYDDDLCGYSQRV